MGTQALLLLVAAVLATAAAAKDKLVLPVLETEPRRPSPVHERPDPHDSPHRPPYHGHHEPYEGHREPVREYKVPDPLDPIKLPPVIPDDMSKPILILGKLPRGSPPYPFSPFDDGTCSMNSLLLPCPKDCSLEWNPVFAADEEQKRVVTFINCCAFRWHVCHYKKRLTYLGRGNPNICPEDTPGDGPNVLSNSQLPLDFPGDVPKDWPQEWQDNFSKELSEDIKEVLKNL